jgi:hypothetical protein
MFIKLLILISQSSNENVSYCHCNAANRHVWTQSVPYYSSLPYYSFESFLVFCVDHCRLPSSDVTAGADEQ